MPPVLFVAVGLALLALVAYATAPSDPPVEQWKPAQVRPEIVWCADCERATNVTLTGQCSRCSSASVLVTQRPRPLVLSDGDPIVLDEGEPFDLGQG